MAVSLNQCNTGTLRFRISIKDIHLIVFGEKFRGISANKYRPASNKHFFIFHLPFPPYYRVEQTTTQEYNFS